MFRLRWISAAVLLAMALLASITAAAGSGSRSPLRIAPHRPNTPADTTNRTTKPGSTAGCGSCHGSSANTAISVSITRPSGPAQLFPGDTGTFRINASKTGAAGTVTFGMNVAASDPGEVLAPIAGQSTQKYTVGSDVELTHTPTIRTLNDGYYAFSYTMPLTATNGSTHNLYGTVGGVNIGGWRTLAAPFAVTAIVPATPSTFTANATTSTSVPLSWSGGGPKYAVVTREGSTCATAPDDEGVLKVDDNISGSSFTVTNLTPATQYCIALFSQYVGADTGMKRYSSTALNVTTTTATGVTPNPYVDCTNGSNSNFGDSSSPLATITYAMSVTSAGGTITVKPGTCSAGTGETFPIVLKSGVKLVSSGGPAVTIIDASAASPRARVIEASANSSTTLLEGFTITGGRFQRPPNGSVGYGGGIFTSGGDLTTISRCIITGNEVHGYDGDPSGTFKTGGHGYGGGIAMLSSNNTIVNCVISANLARGGNGSTYFGSQTPGTAGGNGGGGGIYTLGASSATVRNCTIDSNTAAGGRGGSSNGPGGNGGDASEGGAYSNGDTFYINTIFSNNGALGGQGSSGGSPLGTPGTGYVGGLSAAADPPDYCLFFNNNPTHGDTGTNAILDQDPLYVSGSDLHVRTTSPARAAGTAAGAPAVDLDGTTRGNPPTIGAYEAGLRLQAFAGIGQITARWNTVVGASSYNLYMARQPGLTTQNFQTLTGGAKITGATSPHVLSPLSNGTTYYFILTAVENGVESPATLETSATVASGNWTVLPSPSMFAWSDIAKDLTDGNELYALGNHCAAPPCASGISSGIVLSTDGGKSWRPTGSSMVTLDLRGAIAASGSTVFVATKTGDIYRSTGGGIYTLVLDGGDPGEPGKALEIDPFTPNTILAGDITGVAGSGGKIVRSTDGGNNWASVGTSDLLAYEIAFDPSTSGRVFASGTGTPNVGKSVDNGATWTAAQPASGFVKKALATGPAGLVLAGVENFGGGSQGIFKSTDGGATWNAKNTGLPVTTPVIHNFAVDPNNPNNIHVSTSAGYYVSTNAGESWTLGPASGPFPSGSLVPYGMVISANRRLVAISGGSIYVRTLDPAPAITGISPSTGLTAGGESITINGTGFNPAAGLRVLFGGIEAAVNLPGATATSIPVTAPAHAAGPVDVWVINPDGQAIVSTNAYTYSACTYAITPVQANYSSSGGSGSAQVITTSDCAWTVTGGGGFVTITGGASGTGNGTVQYSVAANTSSSARQETLTIGGRSFTVTQSASGVTPITLNALGFGSSASLTWNAVPGAVSYTITRKNGAETNTFFTSSTSYSDTAVTPGNGYVYQVAATSNTPSTLAFSNPDLAVCFSYTDSSFGVGATIKAVHFQQLRTAVNAARAALGWAPLSFPGTIATGEVVRRSHLVDLRAAVDAVRGGVGRGGVTYTDPTVSAGSTLIRVVHIHDLRGGLQ